jgi:pyrroline-5-carboxylate reductase
VVVWAVKPQVFAEAAAPCAPHVGAALQLSIMAGVRSERDRGGHRQRAGGARHAQHARR